jgi:hypothetical protein
MVEAELQTTDYVWGGSGNDLIRAGGGNDVLFGDFGSSGGVGQDADPATLGLGSGAIEGNDTIEAGGDSGRLSTADAALATVTVGDDIYGGGGSDTFIWKTGDGLDVVRDYEVGVDLLDFNEGGPLTLTAISFAGQDSTLVRTDNAQVHGVILQGVIGLTVDFDDIPLSDGEEVKIADGYMGFDWTQAGIYNPDPDGPLAFLNYEAASDPNFGFIAEANNFEVLGHDDPGETAGAPVVITRATDFDFLGADFTPSGREGMQVTVEGWDDGVLRFSKTVTLGTIDPDSTTFASFDFTSIDELRLSANDGDPATNDYFGFDNLLFLV